MNMNFKQFILGGIIVLIILGTGFFVWNYMREIWLPEPIKVTKPVWLGRPIPDLDKIKSVINDPKFKELEYREIFFEPIEVGQEGRANPFIPFAP